MREGVLMAQKVLVWRAKDETVYIKDDVRKNLDKKMTIGGITEKSVMKLLKIILKSGK